MTENAFSLWGCVESIYSTLAIYNRGFYYLFNLPNVGISLMFGGFSLYFFEIARLLNKSGYKQSAVIDGERTVTTISNKFDP